MSPERSAADRLPERPGADRLPERPGSQRVAERPGADRRAASSQEELRPYQTLVKLVERELELAGRGEVAALRQAVAETGAHLSTMPALPPQAARPLIERARALRARVSIETLRLREGIALTRSTHERRRRIARSYAPPSSRRRYSASA